MLVKDFRMVDSSMPYLGNLDWNHPLFSLCGLDLSECVRSHSHVVSFMDYFGLCWDDVSGLFSGISGSELFSYSCFPSSSQGCFSRLLGNDLIYTESFSKKEGMVRKYHSVYVVESEHSSLFMGDVLKRWILGCCFGDGVSSSFLKRVARYDIPCEKKRMIVSKLKNDSTVIDHRLTSLFPILHSLTVGELVSIRDGGMEYMDGYRDESLFKVYFPDGLRFDDMDCFYLSLCDDVSLYIPFVYLKERDWSLVEGVRVFSIPLYDMDKGDVVRGKFFNGIQCNAPHFNHPLVSLFRELTAE